MTASEVAGYRFPRREQRGLLAGLRGGQLVAVAGGLVAAVGALTALPPGPGALLGLLAAALGCAIAFVPVSGATVEAWMPVALVWAGRRLSRRTVRLVALPLDSRRPGDDGAPLLAGCRLVALPVRAGGERVGVLHDRVRGTASAVLSVEPMEFLLLGPDQQDRIAAAWAACLATLATVSPLHRLQWVCHSGPLDDAGSDLRRQACFLAVSVETPRDVLGRHPRAAEWSGGLEHALAAVESQLRGAGISGVRALSPSAAGGLVAQLAGAGGGGGAGSGGCGTGSRAGGGPPWPLAVAESWDHVRCDGSWHAVYWVAEWPHLEVRPEFLAPLLCADRGRRTVTVTLEPVAPERAARQAEAARTSEVADTERRQRNGILLTARRRLEQEGLAAREADLALGHAAYRMNGFVAVGASTSAELEAGCQQTEQAAARAHLELRRLYGRQAEALTWVLPLTRGMA